MASQRLAKYQRDAILADISKHAFEAREKALEEEESRLAKEVYLDIYPLEVQKKMDLVPAGFLPTTKTLNVKFIDKYTQIHLEEFLKVSFALKGVCAKVYEESHPISVLFFSIEGRKEELENEKTSRLASARAVLSSCTTYRQLIETWPEIEPFARRWKDSNPARPDRHAVVLATSTLNQALGLPPK